MENLANVIYKTYFPGQFTPIQNASNEEATAVVSRRSMGPYHNPKQRKGKMNAPHNPQLCEACMRGLCFPSTK